jgi:hypothetical protein
MEKIVKKIMEAWPQTLETERIDSLVADLLDKKEYYEEVLELHNYKDQEEKEKIQRKLKRLQKKLDFNVALAKEFN